MLTARTTLGDWLDDPVGGPLVRDLLGDVSDLGPARVFALDDLVALSQGRLTRANVDDMVRAANGGELVVAAVPKKAAVPMPVRDDLTLADIQIRDPFLLRHGDNYWLYGSTDSNIWAGPGTGFDTYRSADLHTWEGPVPAFRPPAGFWSDGMFWAPEVHSYQGRWFMFATFTAPDGYRGTQILVAGEPQGPFEPWSAGAITPREWQCLDGTLFVDPDAQPWIVFCQEWTQIQDGAIWAQRLAPDLRAPVGEPVLLFHASAAPWARTLPHAPGSYVTDGPFLFRLDSGNLIMLWSSFGDQGYAMGVAHSSSGLVTGPWTQEDHALWATDGGHGMILRHPDGRLLLTLHQPNTTPHERAVIHPLTEDSLEKDHQ
ncbi:glycoside hydrolase family 43 protein [Actinoplanes couchii]|uniref:Glycoside hydrolase, family 43 n=1 Tax=Actinoplanes couchii TaxID=403638 RepID=A0ABQ3X8G7_9ACTN|nr:glycoside hydrolase family 43 protein [Actinoplanes couchii]MDR6320195.1 beta-xylosidase [Actinoplanes couchii]GID54791.1 hypothetical protein Aco03nite_031950 [Actinoplanes couchii]